MTCRVLHQTAELERELYGEVVSGSVGQHLRECPRYPCGPRTRAPGARWQVPSVTADWCLLLAGLLVVLVTLTAGGRDPTSLMLGALLIGLPAVRHR